MQKVRLSLLFTCLLALQVYGDTLELSDGKTYTGYLFVKADQSRWFHAAETGRDIKLEGKDYNARYNPTGRKNTAAVIPIEFPIQYEQVIETIEKVLIEESAKGHRAIVIELDTPGGRVDITRNLCSIIPRYSTCPLAAYIKGGRFGGAYSAGAIIAMACNKIYAAPNTCIGAATSITIQDGAPADIARVYGEDAAEKFRSAFRNYIASIASSNGHSPYIAMAMEEKDMELLAVARNDERIFIDKDRMLKDDRIIEVVSPEGELLTLTAEKAVDYGFAVKIVTSRKQLLEDMFPGKNVRPIEMVSVRESYDEVEKALDYAGKLMEKITKEFRTIELKHSTGSMYRKDLLRSVNVIKKNAEFLLKFKEKYIDIQFEKEEIQKIINEAESVVSAIR
ncbi:signal peptide peptidase SppA, 36K type [Limihaloglobus sulfuriphilus]|uniref:Signal peptide peptidase SppA, 36K type n=1 Tax=Limihaloglobus sulfuriphilus TaxID=1851148 RepID=A0A1Q2MDC4_9BACT|nr:ATP-dependent Clp protease proteolytic subunit [Limihaloglobus sulfuriphilus]AQQ70696.1 signal peptide peptidase SppA, 36K type [Limihaloglobus sulfuriphilus]